MLYILVYVFVKNCNYTISEIFLSFFNASIMTTGWYIIAAIIMYAVFYVVFKYFKNSISKKIILEFILIICYMAISWLVGCNSWWYTSILGFGIGLIWAYRKEYIDDFIKNNYKIISFFTMLSFIIFYSLPYVLMKFNGIIFVGINIIISLIFIMLLNIIMMKIRVCNNFLNFIGNISLEIYLIHPLILKLISGSGILKIIQFLCIIVLSQIYNFGLKKVYKENKFVKT